MKVPLRELAVIRTHDSLITPLQSSRKHSTRSGHSMGKLVPSDGTETDAGSTARLGHKLAAINGVMCIVL